MAISFNLPHHLQAQFILPNAQSERLWGSRVLVEMARVAPTMQEVGENEPAHLQE